MKHLKYTKTTDIKSTSFNILGFEPYFNEYVTVGYINHKNKTIKPSFGYFAPHKYGNSLKRKAKKIGYNFSN